MPSSSVGSGCLACPPTRPGELNAVVYDVCRPRPPLRPPPPALQATAGASAAAAGAAPTGADGEVYVLLPLHAPDFTPAWASMGGGSRASPQ